MRRRIRVQSASRPLTASSCSTGRLGAGTKVAVTWPWAAPRRTSDASPRPPMARVKASSRIDFPAPVSPVSTQSPELNSRSSLSIRTMSRIDKADSMVRASGGLTVALPGLGDPRPFIHLRLGAVFLQEGEGIAVPFAVRIVVTQHGGCRLRFRDDAQRDIGLRQSAQGLFDLPRGLVIHHDDLEAIDRCQEIVVAEIKAPNRH